MNYLTYALLSLVLSDWIPESLHSNVSDVIDFYADEITIYLGRDLDEYEAMLHKRINYVRWSLRLLALGFLVKAL